jgi:hypothetical protein
MSNCILVVGGNNPELLFEEFYKRRADFLLKFNHVAKAFVLWAIGIEFFQQAIGARLALNTSVPFDEGENRQLVFFGATILGMGIEMSPTSEPY